MLGNLTRIEEINYKGNPFEAMFAYGGNILQLEKYKRSHKPLTEQHAIHYWDATMAMLYGEVEDRVEIEDVD